MSDWNTYFHAMNRALSPAEKALITAIRNNKVVSKNFVAPTQPIEFLQNFQPKFKFKIKTNSGIVTSAFNWSNQLETELYKLGVKLDDPLEEALRGGTLLLSNMQWSDFEFGKNMTDSLVWDFVSERFGNVSHINQILSETPHLNAKAMPSYSKCKDFVKSSINGYGNSLVMQLGYKDKTAYPILVAAVAYFFDVRFSISLRKVMFPGHEAEGKR